MEKISYELPDVLIAEHPASPRDASRLLVSIPPPSSSFHSFVRTRAKLLAPKRLNDSYADLKFSDLDRILPHDAHLVFNQSKVIPARMFASRASSQEPGVFEVMFLSSEEYNMTEAMQQPDCDGMLWRCMIRHPEISVGDNLSVKEDSSGKQLSLEVVHIHSQWKEEEGDGVEASVKIVRPNAGSEQHLSVESAFRIFGNVPLPPYMKRQVEKTDGEAYQTVFASLPGSVAAPTAGLHMTDELRQRLLKMGVKISLINLHVGAGTFRPVTAQTISQHTMHSEYFSVSQEEVRDLIRSLKLERPIVPVGTTTVRVLESLYWLGVLHEQSKSAERSSKTFSLGQWEAYQVAASTDNLPTPTAALESLAEAGNTIEGVTSLCIVPGYQFRLCDGLITNFHQTHSTLLLLVQALLQTPGLCDDMYRHAIDQRYRFLSYGDACFIANAHSHANKSEQPASTEPNSSAYSPGGVETPMRALSTQLDPGTKVLLHSCCAPCSGAMIEQMVEEGQEVTILFYNPNIHPREEYDVRKDENKRYADQLNIPFVDLDYDDVDEWYRRARGMEFSPERGARDWQTEAMSQRKYNINAEQSFYKQEYCGCTYSLRDSNEWRKKEGLERIKIADGNNVYSDAEKDAEEESLEVVAQFFAHT
eukprot:gene21603-25986_t